MKYMHVFGRIETNSASDYNNMVDNFRGCVHELVSTHADIEYARDRMVVLRRWFYTFVGLELTKEERQHLFRSTGYRGSQLITTNEPLKYYLIRGGGYYDFEQFRAEYGFYKPIPRFLREEKHPSFFFRKEKGESSEASCYIVCTEVAATLLRIQFDMNLGVDEFCEEKNQYAYLWDLSKIHLRA